MSHMDLPKVPPQPSLRSVVEQREPESAPWFIVCLVGMMVLLGFLMLPRHAEKAHVELTSPTGQRLPVRCRVPTPGERLQIEVFVHPDGHQDIECSISKWL